MILAEKIMSLRKRMGWSQEELARKLGVSRQSVSKWEASNAMPDVNKIVQMGDLFGVSIDYLLKDSVDDEQAMPFIESGPEDADDVTTTAFTTTPHAVRQVPMEEASEYMDLSQRLSSSIAAAVMLCIWSPVLLVALAGLSENAGLGISADFAAGVGVIVLLVLVAIAVFIFISHATQLKKYEYLEQERIELQYGVEAVVIRKRDAFANTFRLSMAIGVALIILGVIPVIATALFLEDGGFAAVSVSFLLLIVGFGVFLFVKCAVVQSSYDKLLQVEDYTPENKAASKKLSWFSSTFWLCVAAIFLGYGFVTRSWETAWIVWPVAGVLFAAVFVPLKAYAKSKQREPQR